MSPSPASSADEIVAYLESRRSETNLAGMARYGIVTDRALGIPNAQLHPLARAIGRNHDRALALWQSGIREARVLATFTDEKSKVAAEQARRWAGDFNSWEIVDHCADLFVDAGLGPVLIIEFAADDREFVRRAAFAMIASACVHLKEEPDATLLAFLPLIEAHAGDPRNFVMKAVNWALRNIGKRNRHCHASALKLAERLAASPDKTRRWIGKDAARELTDARILARLKG